jgi:predicted nucleic acid-binding protein
MPAARRTRRAAGAATRLALRYTVDASVFVNAFNPHEAGHAASLRFLAETQERGDPVIVPSLLLPEIAAAAARATNDSDAAAEFARAAADLPQLTLVSLTPAVAREAAELAAVHRLRGADAIYVAIARRYGTTLVSRDTEQRTRSAKAVECRTPEEALEQDVTQALMPSSNERFLESAKPAPQARDQKHDTKRKKNQSARKRDG